MKKKVYCVIDFGQSHLKFILITGKFSVARTLVYKNNFKISKDNSFYYDSSKIEKVIKFKINYLSKNFKIISLGVISHGSGCFFISKENKILNGFHFSSNFKNSKLISKYNKLLPNFDLTYTPKYKNFHNLSKNLFIICNKNKNLELMTIPSYITWLFSKKNIIDPSYLSCHSFLWNFRKKKISNFLKNIAIKIPKIQKSGSLISQDKKNLKVYNGMHDTSAAFYFHMNFFNSQNTIYLSTGTTFIFGKYLKKISSINENSKFYYLLTNDFQGAILSRRFHGGLIYDKFKNKNKKKVDYYLASRTIKELDTFKKYILDNKINLVIDGHFTKNSKFIQNIKKYKKNITIYCAKNKYTPSLGMAYLSATKKINLSLKDYYYKV